MAVRPTADSTGYETLAYAGMSATQGKQATHFNIASDDEIAGQHSAADKNNSPDGEASSTNERPDGTGSRPLAGLTTGVSRNRSGVIEPIPKEYPRRKMCRLRSM